MRLPLPNDLIRADLIISLFHMRSTKPLVWCLFLVVTGIVLVGCESESESPSDRDNDPNGPLIFQCDNGDKIRMEQPIDSTAVLTYGGETLRMTQASSTSALRYTGGDHEWWIKGQGTGARGTLFRTGQSDDLPEAIADCVQE